MRYDAWRAWGSGDLVEIEQESFVLAPNLMYPLHRCTPSRRRANVGSPFDCSKGRYTTLKRKSSIRNFWIYLPVRGALLVEHPRARSSTNKLDKEVLLWLNGEPSAEAGQ
jgi:hypothetical protein